MRKSLLFVLFAILIASVGHSQSNRLVLLEHFTQASCGPCAQWNPTVQAILDNNPDIITSIKYQVSWPGYDPMNLDNPTEVAARTSFYNVTGVPSSVLDGSHYNGHPSGWNISTVTSRQSVPSPFDIQIHHELSAGEDTVFVTMLVEAVDNISSSSLTARLAVIEKHIHFNSPPGSNGETDFYNVMKKFIPNTGGTSLPNSFEPGDYTIIHGSWAMENVYDADEISAVGFVQDNVSQEVHQAGNSSASMITPVYGVDASVTDISNLPVTVCEQSISPTITVFNYGSTNLTSVDVNYSINGSPVETYNWTGNLAFLEKDEIMISDVDIEPMEENEIMVYLTNPNGTDDEYLKNDTLIYMLDGAPYITPVVDLTLRTDNNPQETTWEVIDPNGDVVFSGGPYSDPETWYFENFTFEESGCYKFVIYDAGGDGICCSNGLGLYQLTDENGDPIAEVGDSFGAMEETQFDIYIVGQEDIEPVSLFRVYPNPVLDQSTVSFMLHASQEVKTTVFNLLGEMVVNKKDHLSTGHHDIKLDAAGWEEGIYFVQVKTADRIYSEKISVSR